MTSSTLSDGQGTSMRSTASLSRSSQRAPTRQREEERRDGTAKHMARGAFLIGAAVAVVTPPLRIGIRVAGGALVGAEGIVGHFRHTTFEAHDRANEPTVVRGTSRLRHCDCGPKVNRPGACDGEGSKDDHQQCQAGYRARLGKCKGEGRGNGCRGATSARTRWTPSTNLPRLPGP